MVMVYKMDLMRESGWGQGMMMDYKGDMEKTLMIVKGVVGECKMKLVWGYSMVMDYKVILMREPSLMCRVEYDKMYM